MYFRIKPGYPPTSGLAAVNVRIRLRQHLFLINWGTMFSLAEDVEAKRYFFWSALGLQSLSPFRPPLMFQNERPASVWTGLSSDL